MTIQQLDESPRDESRRSAGEVAGDAAEAVGDAVREAGDRFELIGRIGWVGKSVVYLLLGVLFVRIALFEGSDSTGEEANQAGVLETIAETTRGELLLVLLVAGLAVYTLWRLFTVVLPGDWTGRALLDRGGYLVSATVYAFLCVTAIDLIVSDRPQNPDEREDRMVEDLVKDVMSVAFGRLLVVAAGVALLVVAVVFAKKGISRSYHSELSRLDGVEGTAIDHLGRVGWIARGASMGLIGVFLIRAAWLHDPEHAAGLDDSIRQLTGSTWGTALAALVGFGFIAYAVFVLMSARHRVLRGPTNDEH